MTEEIYKSAREIKTSILKNEETIRNIKALQSNFENVENDKIYSVSICGESNIIMGHVDLPIREVLKMFQSYVEELETENATLQEQFETL